MRARPTPRSPPARRSGRCTACRPRSRTCSTSSPAGRRRSGASRRCATRCSTSRCIWAERMERAGAIVIGKTNSPVMGFRATCDNVLFGPTRNPFDTTRNSGGSSGGGAAAVADGMLSFAEGTDGGGSVRIPASWCGIYGYKQSFGRVPFIGRPNAFGGTDPFVYEGLLTRTVADAALGLERDLRPRSPRSAQLPVPRRPARRGRPADRRHAGRVQPGPRRLRRRSGRHRRRGRGRAGARGRGRRGRARRDRAAGRPARAQPPVVPAHHAAEPHDARGAARAGARLPRRAARSAPRRVPALDGLGHAGGRARPAPRPGAAHARSST